MAMFRRGGESYAGHFVAAAPGTHAATVAALDRHCSKDAAILDFGCYFGAMIERLRHAGFRDVSGTALGADTAASRRFGAGRIASATSDLPAAYSMSLKPLPQLSESVAATFAD